LNGEFEAAKKSAGLPSDSRSNRPGLLSLGRQKGLQGLLSSPIYAARFKLDALTNEFLAPLSDLLGMKAYLFGDDAPSSLDCLAFGYLALMLYPSVPQMWLKEAIEARYPRLLKYIWHLRTRFLKGEKDVQASVVLSLKSFRGDDIGLDEARRQHDIQLPWCPSASSSPATTAFTVARDIFGSFPVLSNLFRSDPVQRPQSTEVTVIPTSALPSPLFVNTFFAFSGAFLSAITGFAIYHARTPRRGDMVFQSPRRPLQQFGQANDFLGVFAQQLRAERDWSERWQREGSGGDGALGAEEDMAVVDEVVVEGFGER
jgi:sorting and assembly machinery component 37